MAIQKTYTANTGVVATNGYWKINKFNGDKSLIIIEIAIYLDKASRESGKQPLGYTQFKLNIADGATLASMYTALLALPDFSNALSV